MNKNRHIIGELQEFFANNDSSKAINSISSIMNRIRIQSKVIGSVKNPNCKFTSLQVLQLLELFPFFSIKNAANYSSSALGKVFTCHKDMLYRFMNDGNVNWRRIIYSVFRQLYSRVSRKTTSKSGVKCVIIDDTDLPKTGFKTEKAGKVFSHTQMKPILGFKAMFLCFTDGVSQFLLDFSLHGKEGKRGDRRAIEVNHRANSFKSLAKALLTSDRGLIHRSKRPIEPESCFGNIKFNQGFKRFHLKSTRKTKVEWGLVSLAHNLRKYVAHKAKIREKYAQSMIMVVEKPLMKVAG